MPQRAQRVMKSFHPRQQTALAPDRQFTNRVAHQGIGSRNAIHDIYER